MIRMWGFFGELSYEEFEESFVQFAELKRGWKVLDVACGTGASHEFLCRAVGPRGKIVAVDVSDEMLRRARWRAERLELENIVYKKADAEELSEHFEEESFDAVISCNGVPNFLRPKRALSEMAGLVREGGTLTFSTVNRERCDDHPLLRWMLKIPPGRFPRAKEFMMLLRKLGFPKVKCREVGLMLIMRATKRVVAE